MDERADGKKIAADDYLSRDQKAYNDTRADLKKHQLSFSRRELGFKLKLQKQLRSPLTKLF
ncbi:MAG: hypothetical protein OFPII_17220 [Osedax symbiont Rs1]|nr:MAG: hypothetical protein OFPII_17220 [Osedax symbiont Rs1]